MAVSYIGYDWGAGNNAAVTPSIHASTQVGDLLVAVCYIRENGATYTKPSGWNAWVDSNNTERNFQAGLGENSVKVFWRFYQSGDPSSFTFTPTGGGSNDTTLVQLLTFRGVDATTPFTTGYYLAFQSAQATSIYHASPDSGDASMPAGCAMLGIMARDNDDSVFPNVSQTSGPSPAWTGQASAISTLGADASCHVWVGGWTASVTSTVSLLFEFVPAAAAWNYGVALVLKPDTAGSVGSHTGTGGIKAGGAATTELLQPYGDYTGTGGIKAGGAATSLFYTPVTIGSHTGTGGGKAGGTATTALGTVEWYQPCAPLVSPTPTAGEQFGKAVAVSEDGRTLAVSTATGTVYVYRWGGLDWVLLTSITRTDYAGFGSGLHIPADGALFIAHESYPGQAGEPGKGAAWPYGWLALDNFPGTYLRDGNRIEAENDFDVHANYANAKTIVAHADLNRAVMGIPGRNHNTIIDLNSDDTGWAILSELNEGGTWTTAWNLAASPQDKGARYGDALTVDRNWSRLCVAEPYYGNYAGRIWTYSWTGSGWSEVAGSRLTGADNEFWAFALALTGDGGRLFFSRLDSAWQRVYLADWNAGTWSVSATVFNDPEASDTATASGWGSALSCSGDGRVLIIGHPGRDAPPTEYNLGAVHTYFRIVSGAASHLGSGGLKAGGAGTGSLNATPATGAFGLWAGWDQA
jgi:hypothetical protein